MDESQFSDWNWHVSGEKVHVIKFAKGIDYVSHFGFPQEKVVMALTSKTYVYSSMRKYNILLIILDYLLSTRYFLVMPLLSNKQKMFDIEITESKIMQEWYNIQYTDNTQTWKHISKFNFYVNG